MRSKGKACSVALFPSLVRGDKPVLEFEEVNWTTSRVSLSEVIKGNDEPIQINKAGDLVSGEINLLRFKALNPQVPSIEVSVVGYSQLPPISEISNAA